MGGSRGGFGNVLETLCERLPPRRIWGRNRGPLAAVPPSSPSPREGRRSGWLPKPGPSPLAIGTSAVALDGLQRLRKPSLAIEQEMSSVVDPTESVRNRSGASVEDTPLTEEANCDHELALGEARRLRGQTCVFAICGGRRPGRRRQPLLGVARKGSVPPDEDHIEGVSTGYDLVHGEPA